MHKLRQQSADLLVKLTIFHLSKEILQEYLKKYIKYSPKEIKMTDT